MEILHIENLSFSYPNCENKALSDVSLSINEGDFIVICGASGSGKTTLMRLLKKELSPNGQKTGEILYNGKELESLDLRTSASEIGFVSQNPETQIVTDKVWHELAFGLENLGLPKHMIRSRVAETASYFGISDWYRQDTSSLSGGQKQLLNLSSVMIMQPRLLILDEPTSQLDPIVAEKFITTLQKLNTELGITIILTEHRLEHVFPIADRVAVMENGKVIAFDTPRKIGRTMSEHKISIGFPSAVRIFQALGNDDNCPLTIKEGRDFLSKNFTQSLEKHIQYPESNDGTLLLEAKKLWFRYEKDADDILRDVNIALHKGEIFTVLGSTGAGKTTLLNILSALVKPYKGSVRVLGKKLSDYKNNSLYKHTLALLPQNPIVMFTQDTVRADLENVIYALDHKSVYSEKKLLDITTKLGITSLLDKHPYDLSGGEQQKIALAKVMLTNPKILLLDEPTKGIDAYAKQELISIMRQLKNEGTAILIVTHDVEFSALVSDKCALFFDGEIVSADDPYTFFASNSYYTTSAFRISKNHFPNAILCDDIIKLCKEQKND